MNNRIDDGIGNTPLIELTKLGLPDGIRIFAKLEYLNPGGSIKDRMVRYILDRAESDGDIKPGSTIVENTSGNTGTAIAMLAAARGYQVTLTVPDKVSTEKRNTLAALGAKVIVCPTEAPTSSPDHYVNMARRLKMETPGAFMLDQYDNPLNAEAHFCSTGPEIWAALGNSITAFVAAGSTGGTVSGISRYLRSKNPKIEIILLDPIGSVYFKYFHKGVVDRGEIRPYHVEGVGEDHLAKCTDFSLITDVFQFDDRAAFSTCHLLAAEEGLLCGGSSGANVWGCLKIAQLLRPPATIVTVLPDSGSKYVSKIYNDAWLSKHGFRKEATRRARLSSVTAEFAAH